MNGLDYTLIGSRIRKVRTTLKLTQEEASERCDITNSFYGNIERGDKKMSVETLVKISKADEDNLILLYNGMIRMKGERGGRFMMIIPEWLIKSINKMF